jgi:hypothetical protein
MNRTRPGNRAHTDHRARYAPTMSDPRDDGDDDWPEPIHTPEERERARKAYEATYNLRRRVLRYGYVALAVLVILVIVLALTH